jgi:hypothetical protein
MKVTLSRWILTGLLAVSGIALAGRGALMAEPQDKTPNQSQSALAAFETVREVLQHPRCQNCHIPGDAPLQFDAGLEHGQNLRRGPEGRGVSGLPCSTCHANRNAPASYGANQPPGAPNWHLPPPDQKMVFIGLSSAELCETVKDRKRNGNKSFAALLNHVKNDKLVLWGWDPGVGRAPVSVPHDAFVAAFKTWIEAGAPCPAAGTKTAAR